MSNLSSWIIFLSVGRLFIYLLQQIPIHPQNEFLEKLHNCDLCAGVWIYSALSVFTGLSIWTVLGFPYVPIVSEGITGGVVSFLMWIFVAGWKEKFNSFLVV